MITSLIGANLVQPERGRTYNMSKKALNLSKVFLTFAFIISLLACAFTVNFASASSPVMVNGGSIRYQSQGNAGIRFSPRNLITLPHSSDVPS